MNSYPSGRYKFFWYNINGSYKLLKCHGWITVSKGNVLTLYTETKQEKMGEMIFSRILAAIVPVEI